MRCLRSQGAASSADSLQGNDQVCVAPLEATFVGEAERMTPSGWLSYTAQQDGRVMAATADKQFTVALEEALSSGTSVVDSTPSAV